MKNRTVLRAAVRAVVEHLEGRQLLAADPFANESTIQTLPYVNEFDGSATVGLHDKDGEHIGLTRVQVNKNGRDASYAQANLDQISGTLKITTIGTATTGSNYNADNTLVNGVETSFDASTGAFQITTRLVGPLSYIAEPSEQAGISFGPDQDNYVKLVAVSRPEGTRLQFTDEQGTTHVLDNIVDIGAFSTITSLDLRITGNSATGVVSAFYSRNGAAFVKLSADLTLSGTRKSQFFAASAKAGLIALHKNANGAITATFDRFAIEPITVAARPSVRSVDPSNGSTGVLRNAFVGAQVTLTAGGIDTNTLNSNTVKLYRTSDRALVPANVGTSGGGDVIVLTPTVLLDRNTSYTFEVTDGVKDVVGNAFQSFSSNFATGTTGGEIDPSFSFEKVALSTAVGEQFTALKVGPDGRLYAGTNDGRIFRYSINTDGTLGAPTIITTLQTANGGKRLLTGFAFDPASTASNLILWVNHGQYRFGTKPSSTVDSEKYADEWTGKITKLVSKNTNGIGTDLGKAVDVVTNLPRSARDHLNNQPAFGPDGALYFNQGAMNSGGAPDASWGQRVERQLSSAILRLDPTKVPAGTTLNVRTTDGGGTYNPSAAGAALTIYAKGVRNAYDLVWTDDGFLYAPTNGSAAGGNTPGGGGAPALNNIDVQHDFLYRIQQGGYYGHPNPTRGDYILGGGYTPNTNGVGPDEVPEYGSTLNPDSEYKGFAYDFGINISPNGVLEYQNSGAFGGRLAGKLIVARYSGPDDLIVLTRDASGAIVQSQTGITGTSGLADPLDVTEDPSTGFLYVAEYSDADPSRRKITLLRPIPAGASATADKPRLVFTDIQTSSTNGPAATAPQTVTIRNTGTQPLTIPAGGVSIVDDAAVSGDHASQFQAVNWPGLPATIPVGESISFQVRFQATSTGLKAALLRIQSNDTVNGTLNINLRGIGTSSEASGEVGGTTEPSLQRIMNAFQIPINVGDADGEGTSNFETPRPAGTPNDEIAMQRMVKAGAGPVVIETLASYQYNNGAGGPVTRFGYYSPGTKDDKTELFTIAVANRTSTTPGGGASFDPGANPFALYDTFNGSIFENTTTRVPRTAYSEDALNAWASTSKTKFRFFPLKNPDGSIEPNAYVFATEDFDGTSSSAFDSNDLVGIIRNVRPADAGPEIGFQNLDRGTDGTNVRALPWDVLSFNRIQTGATTGNGVHDTVNLRIRNTGNQTLTISSITLGGASPSSFQIVSGPGAGSTIAAGGSADVQVKFIATSGRIKNATLVINSNDADEPTSTIKLNGFWQNRSENNEEPTLVETVSLFGYGTAILNAGQDINQGGRVARVGDEVLSPYWRRFDPAEVVEVIQLSAYHTQGNVATVSWFAQGTSSPTTVFTHAGVDGQALLPRLNGQSTAFAAGWFRPSTTSNPAFGFKIDTEWSDPTKNPQEQSGGGWGHHVRFWVAKDAAGKVIPGTYLMAMDYSGINYDYNDNLYLVRNIMPVSAPLAPTGASATASGSGIFLNWNDSTEANLAGYNVYRGTSSTFTPSAANRVNTNGLIGESDVNDIFAPSGATTYYAISAVDTSGNESGFTRVFATRTSDTTPPAAPANLNVTGSTNAITLDWDNNTESDLSGYDVYRSTSANGTYTKLNTGGQLTTSSYVDNSASNGVTYFYRVFAIDQSGNQSAAATGSGTRGQVTAPAAPSNLVASGTGPDTASLTWSPSSGAASYRVERKGPSDADFVEIAANVTSTSYNDNGLTPETAYQYRVRAENSAGPSGYSNVGTATTTGVGQPGSFVGTPVGTTGSFTTITPNSGYDVTAGPGQINSTQDAFYFLAKQVTGDFDVKVRVDGMSGANTYTRGGIMARATNDPNSAHVYVAASQGDGFRTARRIVTGGDTALTKTGTPGFPNAWVRLQRVGNQVTAYYGSNGTSWSQIFSLNIVLPQTLQLGLATGSWTSTTNATVRFREFTDMTPQQPQLPGVPSSLQASAPAFDTVNLSWVAGSNATNYRIERRVQGEANFTEIAGNVTTTSYQDTGRSPNTTYEYRVRAQNAVGMSDYSSVASATTPNAPQPGSLTGTGVGTTGSFTTITDGSAYDVSGGPGMINSTSDAFYFLSKEVTGDFDVKVRVDGTSGGNAQTRGGIMARATNTPNSAHVYVAASQGDGFRTARRLTTGGNTELTKNGTPAFPNAWVRLQRVGNQVTAYYGSNGTSWTQIFSLNIVLPQTLQLGLATGSWTTTTNATVRYREFGDVTPPTPQVPGAPSSLQANAPTATSVNLSWVAGSGATTYRIERRVQGEPDFTEIAGNVATTSFQDTGRDPSTTYEYRVRSENAVGLSGSYSNTASVTTPGVGTPVDGGTYEAEVATLVGAQAATGFPGYSGSGFVDYINASGDYVEFNNVSSATTGNRTLRLRYALQAGASRTLNVTVNGVAAGTVTFAPTASWTAWSTTDINLALVAGNNTIRLTASGQSGPNFDSLTLVSGSTPPPADGGTFQAETAVRSGAVPSTQYAGYTGSGYADYVNATGDYVEFQNVPAAAAGNRTLRFRFANGITSSRTLALTINGVAAGTVTFAGTTQWTTWTTVDVTAALAAGNNTIRLTATGQSGPNLDSLTVL